MELKLVPESGRMNLKHPYVYLKGQHLTLGKHYMVYIGNEPTPCKLIQVTPCGYNLLNLRTDRCILKRHLYVPKSERERYSGDKKFFFAPSYLNIYKPIMSKAV